MKSLRRIALILLACIATPVLAGESGEAPSGVELRGSWEQGAVLFGRAPPGTRIWLEGRALRLTPSGDFVFGLDRDAPAEATLKVQLPDATAKTYRYQIARREYDIQRIEGLPPKMVTPPPEVIERIKADQREVAAARRYEGGGTGFLESFIWPATGRIWCATKAEATRPPMLWPSRITGCASSARVASSTVARSVSRSSARRRPPRGPGDNPWPRWS